MARTRALTRASRRWICGVVGVLGLLHALLVVTADGLGGRRDPYERPYLLTYVGQAAVVRPAPHVQPVREPSRPRRASHPTLRGVGFAPAPRRTPCARAQWLYIHPCARCRQGH